MRIVATIAEPPAIIGWLASRVTVLPPRSPVIPRFALARPTTLADAWAAFAATDGDAAWVAGGTELLQVMKMGLAQIGTLIDLKGIAELRGISETRRRLAAHRRRHDPSRHRALGRSSGGTRPALATPRGGRRQRPRPEHGHASAATSPSPSRTRIRRPSCWPAARSSSWPGRPAGARSASATSSSARWPRRATPTRSSWPSASRPPLPAEGRAYAEARLLRAAGRLGRRSACRSPTADRRRHRRGRLADRGARARARGRRGPGRRPGHRRTALAAACAEAGPTFAGLDAVPDLNGSAEFKRHLVGVLLGTGRPGGLRGGPRPWLTCSTSS